MTKTRVRASLCTIGSGALRRLKVPVLSIHLGTDAYSKSQYLNSCSRLGAWFNVAWFSVFVDLDRALRFIKSSLFMTQTVRFLCAASRWLNKKAFRKFFTANFWRQLAITGATANLIFSLFLSQTPARFMENNSGTPNFDRPIWRII